MQNNINIGAGEPNEGTAKFDVRFKHGFVEAGNTKLHFVRGGVGKPVLLLHGFPATWYDYHRIMPQLLDIGYDVIAFDLPGLGDSEPLIEDFSHQSIAKMIYAACKNLGLENPSLVAHDMSAWLALPLLRIDPDYFRSLVVLDVNIPGLGLEPLIREIFLWHFNFHQGAGELAAKLVEGKEELYLSYFFSLAANPEAISSEEKAEFLRAYSRKDAFKTAFKYYQGIEDAGVENQKPVSEKLTLPVLALGGEYGGGAPIASWQNVATNVTGETIENTGHYLMQEQPVWLLNKIVDFLKLG